MKYDVFISYSSIDQKIVEGICGYLESRGIRCFVAYRDIPPGVVWAAAIVEALDESQMMVIAFSEHFNGSEQVDREIELAAEDRKPILTFRLADTPFKGAKKYYLKNINWIDAFPQPDLSFGSLYSNICKLLGREEKTIIIQEAPVTEKSADDWYREAKALYDQEKFSEALLPFKTAAEKGHAVAQLYLGKMYYNGKGVEKDFDQTVAWIRKAANQNHAEAQDMLGMLYANGYGVPKDKTETMRWYRKAAENGHIPSLVRVGVMYQTGSGVERDAAEAVKWFRKAADQGNAAGQYFLARMYEDGNGVAKDVSKALTLLREAAKQSYPPGIFSLGLRYMNGRGVVKDETVGLRLLREAARLGNPVAKSYLKKEGIKP